MAPYIWTLLGLLVAGTIYSQLYPLSITNIRYAITIGAFAMLLIFFFGNAAGTRLNRFVGSVVATAVLIVTGFLVLGIFQPFFASVVLVAILIAGFAAVRQYPTFLSDTLGAKPKRRVGFTSTTAAGFESSSSVSDMFARMMGGLDPGADPLSQLRAWLTADTRMETAAFEAQTALHIHSIQAAMHAILRLAGETAAVDKANDASGKAGLHPGVYHTLEYQLEKLRAEISAKSKIEEIELEELRKMVDIKIAQLAEEVKRKIREQREEERRRARSSQTNNGQKMGPDIPDPERTTGS